MIICNAPNLKSSALGAMTRKTQLKSSTLHRFIYIHDHYAHMQVIRQSHDMLQQLDWTPLEERRKQLRLTMMLKFHQGDIIIDSAHTPTLKTPKHNTRYSYSGQYAMESWSRDYWKFSFFPRTVKVFNKLPLKTISLSGEPSSQQLTPTTPPTPTPTPPQSL